MVDAAYLEKLYRNFGGKMYDVCFKYSGDAALSADIVQEVFLSIWERREFIQLLQPERYLTRAVKLKLLEHYRNTRKRRELFNHIVHTINLAENYTENDILSKELTTTFNRQLEELPDKQRAAFKLQQQNAYTTEQIADTLEIDRRTVNNYLSLATRQLKSFLKANLLFFL